MGLRVAVFVASLAAAGAFSGVGAKPSCKPGSNIAEFVEGNTTPPGPARGAPANVHTMGGGSSLCLAAATYGAQDAGPSPVLVVVLHGDATSGGPVDYHFAFAKTLAKKGVVAVALLRPGYFDPANRQSEGTHHQRTDSYTPVNINAVGGAIRALKDFYKPKSVIYVGHSGGAAIGGVLLGKQPNLINAAVLVSCPCDIKRWRAERKRGPWSRSESPSAYTAKVPVAAKVIALTGADDENTSPGLAESYVEALGKRNVNAKFQSVPKGTHDFSGPMPPAAAAAVASLM